MSYPSDLTDSQWKLLEPLLVRPSKRGPKHGADLRTVVDAMLYISKTGCQWRYLPSEFGKWTRVWSQFRRWSQNGTWTLVLAALHEQARVEAGRTDPKPSLVVIDSHLSRGASNGRETFHRRGGPYGATNGAKRVVAVDVIGLPLAARVVPANLTETQATERLLEDLVSTGQAERLEVVLVDKGVPERSARGLSRQFGFEVRRVGWDPQPVDPVTGKRVFKLLAHAWRVEVAHGQVMRRRRSARSFENTTLSGTAWLQLGCVSLVLGSA